MVPNPPYLTSWLTDAAGRRYYDLFLPGDLRKPGERRTWSLWIPQDLKAYLAGAYKPKDWRRQTYNCLLSGRLSRDDRSTTLAQLALQPTGEFTEESFQEQIGDVILASGITDGVKTFAEFEEDVADMAARTALIYQMQDLYA